MACPPVLMFGSNLSPKRLSFSEIIFMKSLSLAQCSMKIHLESEQF